MKDRDECGGYDWSGYPPNRQVPNPGGSGAQGPYRSVEGFSRKWEIISTDNSDYQTKRLRVPNGWLVRCVEGLCFVPDCDHRWVFVD